MLVLSVEYDHKTGSMACGTVPVISNSWPFWCLFQQISYLNIAVRKESTTATILPLFIYFRGGKGGVIYVNIYRVELFKRHVWLSHLFVFHPPREEKAFRKIFQKSIMEPETGGVRHFGQRSGNILKSRLNSGTNISHTFKKK